MELNPGGQWSAIDEELQAERTNGVAVDSGLVKQRGRLKTLQSDRARKIWRAQQPLCRVSIQRRPRRSALTQQKPEASIAIRCTYAARRLLVAMKLPIVPSILGVAIAPRLGIVFFIS